MRTLSEIILSALFPRLRRRPFSLEEKREIQRMALTKTREELIEDLQRLVVEHEDIAKDCEELSRLSRELSLLIESDVGALTENEVKRLRREIGRAQQNIQFTRSQNKPLPFLPSN